MPSASEWCTGEAVFQVTGFPAASRPRFSKFKLLDPGISNFKTPREEKIHYEDVLYCRHSGGFIDTGRGCANLGRRLGIRQRFRHARSGECWSQCQPERADTSRVN